MNRAETGRRGEAAAARWYQKQGAQLLAHNYHTRMGELDLVLREPDGTIVICEVKTRSQGMLQRPAAAVDPAKQHRLICLSFHRSAAGARRRAGGKAPDGNAVPRFFSQDGPSRR